MSEIDDLLELRRQKVDRLRELGIDPYPARVSRTATTCEAVERFEQAERLDQEGPELTVAGRIVGSIRRMGKAAFTHVLDGEGRLQLHLRADILGDEDYETFLRLFDVGDFVEATGRMFRTKRGEATLEVRSVRMLTKALRPLPEKWHGLQDVEKRYRQRYLDLITNPDARQIALTRSRIISGIRQFMDARGFVEVETPTMLPIYGGAQARPFTTYYNALDRTYYLRIATELYLKRLIVGGLDRVYEIGKVYRNEGISTKHNPEFTLLESYEAYADYQDVMRMVEELFLAIAEGVCGSAHLPFGDQVIDFTPPWRRLTLRGAILAETGVDVFECSTVDTLLPKVLERRIHPEPGASWGKLVDELLSAYVEPKLIQPTFLIDYPVELSPLAKRKPDSPALVERFEPFVGGRELGNAFSELNDPFDQRERLEEQAARRAAGDEEASPVDEDFLTAIEHGMPPTGGLGLGIDRIVMLFTGQASIREVILFPQLRTRD